MPATTRPRALIGWRLLALLYDAFPVIALWMLLSTLLTPSRTPLPVKTVLMQRCSRILQELLPAWLL